MKAGSFRSLCKFSVPLACTLEEERVVLKFMDDAGWEEICI